jgi:hypothetical protein
MSADPRHDTLADSPQYLEVQSIHVEVKAKPQKRSTVGAAPAWFILP